MSEIIKLRKGFDIKLVGKAERKKGEVDQPETFALKPTDFLGIQRPKLHVAEGDQVKVGTPILFDKKQDQVQYVSPVSGEIAEIVRGEKRRLLEVRILADKEMEHVTFDKHSVSEIANLSREHVVSQLTASGVWPNIIQRPYGVVANPEDEPKAIFISGFDSHPLAPDYGYLFHGTEQYFQEGINILKKLTPGAVHLNVNADGEISQVFSQAQNVQLNKFSGPHPAGNVGVQIHHLDPINKGEVAWTINPFGVIQIGKLFLEGIYDSSKMVAVAGSEVKQPQYYKTHIGASISKFVEGNINSDNVRYISGNVLTGEQITSNGYIGFYDHLVTVVPEGDYYEMFGWIKPSFNKLSFHRAFGLLSFLSPGKEHKLDTNLRGEPRPFVQTGTFEQVTPMDIYPTYLLKAILAEDFDDMEGLGIYEVIEEDFALCEFIDVSKHNVQGILREGLELMQHS